MATTVIQNRTTAEIVHHDFSWAERYTLRRFHPRSIFIDMAGTLWFLYYFWNQDWRTAVGTLVLTRLISLASVMNVNTDLLARSTLGKIGLLHLNPMNMFVQIIGVVFLLYGVWEHSAEMILSGSSIILLGHVFGWAEVDEKFADF